MAISRGTSTIKRRHSRNFTSAQADARLREVVQPYQEQGKRALEVDSFSVKYYHQCRSTTVCTCKQTAVTREYAQMGETNLPPTIIKQDSPVGTGMSIDFRRNLFGTQSNSIEATDNSMDMGDDEDMMDIEDDEDEDDAPKARPLYGTSADCALCYKTGYVPGYTAYGYERFMLSTHNIVQEIGYFHDVTLAPHRMKNVNPRAGFVEFVIEVPKYFQSALFSIRNNRDVLDDTFFTEDDHPLTFNHVRAHAGRHMKLRVKSIEFTHAVLEFDLGTDKTLANLAQQQKTVDWTLFSTLGNIQIILPMTIQTVQASDVIYVPDRHVSFKITDVTYLTTARDSNLDWSVSTRVLQPQEALTRIYKGFRLY